VIHLIDKVSWEPIFPATSGKNEMKNLYMVIFSNNDLLFLLSRISNIKVFLTKPILVTKRETCHIYLTDGEILWRNYQYEMIKSLSSQGSDSFFFNFTA